MCTERYEASDFISYLQFEEEQEDMATDLLDDIIDLQLREQLQHKKRRSCSSEGGTYKLHTVSDPMLA